MQVRRHRVQTVILVLIVGMVGFVAYFLSANRKTGTGAAGDSRSPLYPTGADVGYVDGSTCAGCHSKISETYRQTGMGQSFRRPRPDDRLEGFQPAPTFYHRASDRHYTMYRKDGRFYQRRHQIGFDGQETNVFEKEIHFVVGSGNHVRTYLHRTAEGRIFELPLAWYAENGGRYALNPGYDHANHPDFRREITHECVFCHNAFPEIAPGSDRVGSEPRFPGRMPEGIDCQRCHGPGRAHVEAARSGDPQMIRKAIVNPAGWTPERQLELCMQCHLETTSTRLPHTILRLNRGAFSYRPGEPLADYALHFDHAPRKGWDDKFEIASHAYRLRKSVCFERSAGKMTCTTCHDPHSVPRGESAVEHYARACGSCHQPDLQKQIEAKRHTSVRACAACHMPRRRTDDVIHVVMTDHYIQREKPSRDLLAPLTERHDTEETAYQGPVVLYYPPQLAATPESELYLAMAQVKQFANLAEGVPRLAAAIEKHRPADGEFYFQLGEAYAKLGQTGNAVRMYETATVRKPGFRPAWIGLAKTLSLTGEHARGADALQRALALTPKDPVLLNYLGLMYLKQGRSTDAIAALRQAVESDPDQAEAFNNLGGALQEGGDRSGAEAAYRSAIRIQPDFSAAHNNLANLLAPRGDFAETEYFFRKAIYHNPKYALAHYGYGMALAAVEKYDEARRQFEAAARIEPNLAEAQSGLADMLALEGFTAKAIHYYKRALEINPGFGAAHLGLGSALASQSKRTEAAEHLERAAQSSDGAIRQAAQEALRSLETLSR